MTRRWLYLALGLLVAAALGLLLWRTGTGAALLGVLGTAAAGWLARLGLRRRQDAVRPQDRAQHTADEQLEQLEAREQEQDAATRAAVREVFADAQGKDAAEVRSAADAALLDFAHQYGMEPGTADRPAAGGADAVDEDGAGPVQPDPGDLPHVDEGGGPGGGAGGPGAVPGSGAVVAVCEPVADLPDLGSRGSSCRLDGDAAPAAPAGSLIVRPAEVGELYLDTAAQITPRLLQAILGTRIGRGRSEPRPISGILLYVRYDEQRSAWDWDADELDLVLSAGLGAGFVQRCRRRWTPTEQLGRSTGQAAVAALQELGAPYGGLPRGTQCWLDVEGGHGRNPAGEIAYGEAWAAELLAAGDQAGLYVGAGSCLTGQQIGALRGITAYWDSLSDVARQTPLPRRWCMEQVRQIEIGGVQFDLNIAGQDTLGGRPLFVRRASAS